MWQQKKQCAKTITIKDGKENRIAKEDMSREATSSTPMLTKEENREMFKLIKKI